MSYIVLKTIKGRQYRYLQRSYREGDRVRTESIYLGPAGPGGRRKGILSQIGDLIAANRAEPGTRLMNQMIEQGQKQAAARDAANQQADDRFYAEMHERYGMVKGPADPVPVEKAPSTVAYASPASTPAAAAVTESPSDEGGAEAVAGTEASPLE